MPFQRLEALPAVYRGMLWTIATGILFTLLNAVLRHSSPISTQTWTFTAGATMIYPSRSMTAQQALPSFARRVLAISITPWRNLRISRTQGLHRCCAE